MKSKFQEFHAERLKSVLNGITLYDEMPVKEGRRTTKRIDLGTPDYRYGIEIKSGTVDLKSGCGLNQEKFIYPYVLIHEKCLAQAVGCLYVNGMHRTGVICIDDNDCYYLAKSAIPDNRVDAITRLLSSADYIARTFWEHNAAREF